MPTTGKPWIVANENVPTSDFFLIQTPPKDMAFATEQDYWNWVARHCAVIKNVGEVRDADK